jgi:hypothetical protein
MAAVQPEPWLRALITNNNNAFHFFIQKSSSTRISNRHSADEHLEGKGGNVAVWKGYS